MAYFWPCCTNSVLSSAKLCRGCYQATIQSAPRKDTEVTHIGLMGKQCYKSDEQLTACIEADRIQYLLLQYFCGVVQRLDQLEHSTG